jgi:hypothetical protein
MHTDPTTSETEIEDLLNKLKRQGYEVKDTDSPTIPVENFVKPGLRQNLPPTVEGKTTQPGTQEIDPIEHNYSLLRQLRDLTDEINACQTIVDSIKSELKPQLIAQKEEEPDQTASIWDEGKNKRVLLRVSNSYEHPQDLQKSKEKLQKKLDVLKGQEQRSIKAATSTIIKTNYSVVYQ